MTDGILTIIKNGKLRATRHCKLSGSLKVEVVKYYIVDI